MDTEIHSCEGLNFQFHAVWTRAIAGPIPQRQREEVKVGGEMRRDNGCWKKNQYTRRKKWSACPCSAFVILHLFTVSIRMM